MNVERLDVRQPTVTATFLLRNTPSGWEKMAILMRKNMEIVMWFDTGEPGAQGRGCNLKVKKE